MKTSLCLPFIIWLLAIASCKKDQQSTALRLKLTDSPAAYDQVNVDLQQVNIKMSGDTSAWLSLSTKAGIYNLLALQNGLDTLIGEGTFPAGKVMEVRLVLGTNNTIKADGQLYPLTIPSGSESGLKIKLQKTLASPLDSVVIDFDAALSVQHEQDGFKLRPVIKVAH
jgi:hypothetical protein